MPVTRTERRQRWRGKVRKVRFEEVKVSGLRVSSQKSARAIGELRSLTLRLVWPKAASQ